MKTELLKELRKKSVLNIWVTPRIKGWVLTNEHKGKRHCINFDDKAKALKACKNLRILYMKWEIRRRRKSIWQKLLNLYSK